MDIVVVGGDSFEAEALLSALAESELPLGEVHVLGVREDAAARVDFGGRLLKPQPIAGFDFRRVEVALFVGDAPPDACSPDDAQRAGALALDLSSGRWGGQSHRTVMPGAVSAKDAPGGVLALPSPGLAQVYSTARPFLAHAEGAVHGFLIEPVSRLGKSGVEHLARQTARVLNLQPVENTLVPVQMAFNTLPVSQGDQGDRDQLDWRDLVAGNGPLLSMGRVMAPVFFGTTACVQMSLPRGLDMDEPYAGDRRIQLMQEGDPPLSPVGDAAGQDQLYVRVERRARDDVSELTVWSVADNLHWAIAANAVDVLTEILT
ncbi:MAG: Asd/ArgC dimerization domain-containing protein [Gammaproteobacteria bacterium]